MLKYLPYIYFAKSDSTKEAIDKILSFDYENALWYFASRKKMSEEEFLEIYTIEEHFELK